MENTINSIVVPHNLPIPVGCIGHIDAIWKSEFKLKKKKYYQCVRCALLTPNTYNFYFSKQRNRTTNVTKFTVTLTHGHQPARVHSTFDFMTWSVI